MKIEGMMCNPCVMHVQKALAAIPGVAEVTVSLDEKNAKVKLNIADGRWQSALALTLPDICGGTRLSGCPRKSCANYINNC